MITLASVDSLLPFDHLITWMATSFLLQGVFAADNLLALWPRLSAEEQSRYPFALDRIPWREYLWNTHLPGIRKCVIILSMSPFSSKSFNAFGTKAVFLVALVAFQAAMLQCNCRADRPRTYHMCLLRLRM